MSVMPRRASALIAVLTLAAPVVAAAQRILPPDSTVQAVLDRQIKVKGTVGLVVGLIDADGTRRTFTAGKADNGDLPLDGNTLFEIGSITKTFTTGLLAEMASRGEVRLDQPVQSLLPAAVKIPSRNGREITLLDLASVSSGLPGMPNNFKPVDPRNPYADYSVQQLYDFLNGHTLTRDIGSQYEYSNLGMGLLGHALALKAGTSYFDVLNQRILRPLGMRDTWIELSPALRRRLALGHSPAGAVVSNWDIPTLAGAGALRSSVNDMFRFLAANLDSTSKPLGRILGSTHLKRTETANPNLTVGMGWHIIKTPGGTVVWHNGGTGGYRTFTGFDPVRRVGVIVLSNSSISVDDVGLHLLDPAVPLTPPPPARKEVAIDPAVLPAYAGTYQLDQDVVITVTVADGALWVEATGQPKARAFPESPTSFFFKEGPVVIAFVKDANGTVTQLVVRQPGGEAVAKKIR